MRIRSIGLLPQILAAILLGIGAGLVLPPEFVRVFATFDSLFGNFLTFVIPLLIVGLITPAISELGAGAGRWLLITTAFSYVSTVFAGLLGWAAATAFLPALLAGHHRTTVTDPSQSLLRPYFELQMPPVFGVIPALVLSFAVGVTLTVIDGATIHRGFVEFREIVRTIISTVIIPLLPLYVFGIFCNMTAGGEAWTIISTFLGVILLVFGLTLVLLVAQFALAGLVAHRNPWHLLRTMLPAYMTALGTSSSVATIPVTLRQTITAGVSHTVASFVIPLCATVHLAGSALKITVFALAVMTLDGHQVDPGRFLLFVLMLGVTMVAAPGVPAGAIMTSTALLGSMLGFGEAQTGLMIAIYVAVDSFGTATNVTGDGAIATIIEALTDRHRVAGTA